MNDRRKAMRLTLILPWLMFGAFLLSLRLHGAWLEILVGVFAVSIGSMLVYVAMQMMKAKRRRR
jgi:small neutral amino acid transporter SnatA (MarC family)